MAFRVRKNENREVESCKPSQNEGNTPIYSFSHFRLHALAWTSQCQTLGMLVKGNDDSSTCLTRGNTHAACVLHMSNKACVMARVLLASPKTLETQHWKANIGALVCSSVKYSTLWRGPQTSGFPFFALVHSRPNLSFQTCLQITNIWLHVTVQLIKGNRFSFAWELT